MNIGFLFGLGVGGVLSFLTLWLCATMTHEQERRATMGRTSVENDEEDCVWYLTDEEKAKMRTSYPESRIKELEAQEYALRAAVTSFRSILVPLAEAGVLDHHRRSPREGAAVMLYFLAGIGFTLGFLLALLWLTTDPPPDYPVSIHEKEEYWGEL